MRRQLTTREWMLLALLGVILLASGYMLLFYMPLTAERDRCLGEAESCRAEIEAAQLRLEEKRRMERELEDLFSAGEPPRSIADYDNLQPVMFELNSILASTQDYSLSFSTVDASQAIVRRSISMSFTTGTYESAKAVLQQLHDSAFRCMLDSVNVSVGQGAGRRVRQREHCVLRVSGGAEGPGGLSFEAVKAGRTSKGRADWAASQAKAVEP